MNPAEKISHITPKRKWFDVDIKGIWDYRYGTDFRIAGH